jgi:hypothetical protein
MLSTALVVGQHSVGLVLHLGQGKQRARTTVSFPVPQLLCRRAAYPQPHCHWPALCSLEGPDSGSTCIGGAVRKYVYMAYNFVTKERTQIVTMSGEVVAERLLSVYSAEATF